MITLGINKLEDKLFIYHGISNSMKKWEGDICKIRKVSSGWEIDNISKSISKWLPYIQVRVTLITHKNYPEYFLWKEEIILKP